METQQPCKLSRVLLAHHQIDAMCLEALSAVEVPISLGVSHLKFSALAYNTFVFPSVSLLKAAHTANKHSCY
jgi:hypothetical protein